MRNYLSKLFFAPVMASLVISTSLFADDLPNPNSSNNLVTIAYNHANTAHNNALAESEKVTFLVADQALIDLAYLVDDLNNLYGDSSMDSTYNQLVDDLQDANVIVADAEWYFDIGLNKAETAFNYAQNNQDALASSTYSSDLFSATNMFGLALEEYQNANDAAAYVLIDTIAAIDDAQAKLDAHESNSQQQPPP